MKKVLTILMAVLMILALSACSKPSESGDALYDMPDFSIPPTAVGESPVVTLEEMIQYVNETETFTLPFATYLDGCKQTLYKTEELKDGEEAKESLAPLGMLTYILKENDFAQIAKLSAEDFDILQDGKLAKIKEGKGPSAHMNAVVTDFCLDLTDTACVIRGMYIMDTDSSSTYFFTFRLKYHGDNKYTITLRSEDYGVTNSQEYVFISEEELVFTTDEWKINECTYQCKQDTSLVESQLNSSGNATIKKQSERLTSTVELKYVDGKYQVDRTLVMKQAYDSYNPDVAQEVYNIHQTIEFKDGHYLLTEVANYKDENGTPATAKQFAVFEEKA